MPDLLEQLLPELAKLSPQGNVHAKTLYAAINLIKRIPPGPLFAALITQTKFRAMGDGYWLAALTIEVDGAQQQLSCVFSGIINGGLRNGAADFFE